VQFLDTGTGSSGDTSVTLTDNIVNSAGTIVATNNGSRTVKNGDIKDISVSFKPSATGTYTIQGIATDSTGKVIGQNLKVGTITVN